MYFAYLVNTFCFSHDADANQSQPLQPSVVCQDLSKHDLPEPLSYGSTTIMEGKTQEPVTQHPESASTQTKMQVPSQDPICVPSPVPSCTADPQR